MLDPDISKGKRIWGLFLATIAIPYLVVLPVAIFLAVVHSFRNPAETMAALDYLVNAVVFATIGILYVSPLLLVAAIMGAILGIWLEKRGYRSRMPYALCGGGLGFAFLLLLLLLLSSGDFSIIPDLITLSFIFFPAGVVSGWIYWRIVMNLPKAIISHGDF